MMLRQFLFGMMAWMVGCPQAAHATVADSGCKLQIVTDSSQWRINNIDVFASEPTLASFDLQLVNSGTADCSGSIVLDTQGTPFGLSDNGGRRIFYSIIDHASGTDLTPRNGRSRLHSGRLLVIPPGGQTLARFEVLVPGAFPTDGTYSQQLFVEVSNPSTGDVIAQHPVTLAAVAASTASIALSGDFTRIGGAADVDLGELTQGSIKIPIIVHVKSTRAYQISSTSENAGKLVLAGTSWAIPYRLSFDGTTVDPAGGVFRSSSGGNGRADNLHLGFIVVGTTNVAAGRYSDTVTLDVSLI